VYIAKISAKGQVSIPRAVRQAAHLAPGDRVGFETREGAILVIPLRARTVSDLRGVWKTGRPITDLADLRAQRAAAWAAADQASRPDG
jgi:AbrB family looped-hinge helix DNA binding protein